MIPLLVVIGCLATRIATAADSSTIVTFDSVPGGIEVKLGGKPYTTYHYANPDGTPLRRPYLYPVLADDGTPVTSDQHLVPGGDHPHHRSIWTGHGDVNGADHWGSNDRQPGGPRQRAAHPLPEQAGHQIIHTIAWEGPNGFPKLAEKRIYSFPPDPQGGRCIDVITNFSTINVPVRLGDTKEAGVVAVRVAAAISASPIIGNSEGGSGEAQCWGKAAEWCSISGKIGATGYTIAVFAHPENPRHPMRWHVRSYGLLAANPFGLSAFDHSRTGTGDLVIEPGGFATFRHRIVIWSRTASVARSFEPFAGEPGPRGNPRSVHGPSPADWRPPTPNPWWKFDGDDGILTGTQDSGLKGSVLESRETYRDVIVNLEYRYSGDVDSGVFLRAGQAYQCQIGVSRSLQRDMTGSIYDPQRKYVAEAKAAPALNRSGEWNRLRIEARGDRFRHWLNGTLVLDYTDPAFVGEGPIGLQLHAGIKDMKIEFRNIRVLRLASPPNSAGK